MTLSSTHVDVLVDLQLLVNLYPHFRSRLQGSWVCYEYGTRGRPTVGNGAGRGGKGCDPTIGPPLWGRGPPRKFRDNFPGSGPPPLTHVSHPLPVVPAPLLARAFARGFHCVFLENCPKFRPTRCGKAWLLAPGSPVIPPALPPGCPPGRFPKFQRGQASKQKDVGEETRDKSMMRN